MSFSLALSSGSLLKPLERASPSNIKNKRRLVFNNETAVGGDRNQKIDEVEAVFLRSAQAGLVPLEKRLDKKRCYGA